MNMKSLGLINYEGWCLMAYKNGSEFIIKDQWKKEVAKLSEAELLDFIDGTFDIKDSSGKSWNFANEHRDSKPPFTEIYNFFKY